MLAGRGRLPNEPGVYRFRDGRGRVLYVGRATQLRSRVGSYWSDLGDRRHLVRMVAAVAAVEALVCDSVHEAAWLERNVLEHRKPRWNRVRGGMETPVYLGLTDSSAAPGLRLSYEPDAFGPYLGSQRVRQALSGLHRIRPLRYTGTRLTGAERAMAEKRGVTAADRTVLAAELAATLARDPEAVGRARADLAALRDQAAATLAFEVAGQIQEELAALDWITAPQRVTSREPGDFTAAGWSDGVLLTLTVRAGRLIDWAQRPCGERAAAPHLAATPGAWAGYAQRNAELAAALTTAGSGSAAAPRGRSAPTAAPR
ncbi:hypothetical protein ACFFX1_46360 [Dactylosporangium sucinum]|uniref:GIY-YIG domain-containing protein n=1 Tax=Dactylosporangium sucinum TaxID=1424081 RepID=A0A917TPD3_9ACTN|nr:hypothetical protein [Dactylosporangium sucinum]GGM30685.1 hypothetical protein GCM10007977_034960 [Dactylosporangium sucinum]